MLVYDFQQHSQELAYTTCRSSDYAQQRTRTTRLKREQSHTLSSGRGRRVSAWSKDFFSGGEEEQPIVCFHMQTARAQRI